MFIPLTVNYKGKGRPGPSFSKHLKSVSVVICWAAKIETVIISWKIPAKHWKFIKLNLGWFSLRKTKQRQLDILLSS